MLMNSAKSPARATGRSYRKWLIGAGTVVVVAVLAGGSWAMWKSYSKQKLLASLDNPEKIREAVQQGQITRQDARDAFGQAMEARMNQTMDEFFALPAGAARDAYLDKLIDEMEARRREWQARATTRPTTRPEWADRERDGDRERPTPEQRAQRFAQRADSTAPERRAQMAEFRAAMRQRMIARGMSPDRGFGGGPGRGGFGGGGGGGRPGGGGGGGSGR